MKKGGFVGTNTTMYFVRHTYYIHPQGRSEAIQNVILEELYAISHYLEFTMLYVSNTTLQVILDM